MEPQKDIEQAQRDLKEASADVKEAIKELKDAERNVEKAEARIEAAIEEEKHPSVFQVDILYNGVKKPFEVRREETVKTLLDKAIKEFGPIPNPHTLSLFTEGGDELNDEKTLAAAGVKPRELLLLRPSKVKGGR